LQLDEFATMRGDKMTGRSGQFSDPPGLCISKFGLVKIAGGQAVQFLLPWPSQAALLQLSSNSGSVKTVQQDKGAIPIP
jgi:hypothetical protein